MYGSTLRMHYCAILFILFSYNKVFAQQLSIEEIMQGPDFVGHLPESVHWSDDGRMIYFKWNPEGLPQSDYYQHDLTNSSTSKVEDQSQVNHADLGSYNADKSKKIYEIQGDLYLWDKISSISRRITSTVERESNPQYLNDDHRIAFMRDRNFYIWDDRDGSLSQITNFKEGNKKSFSDKEEWEVWLERDQLEYFDILEKRKEERDYRDTLNNERTPERPVEIYSGKSRLRNQKISPDAKFVTYQLVFEMEDRSTMVPDYVTESGYIKELKSRPKVGTDLERYEHWIYDVDRDTTYLIDPEQIEGIYDKPEYLRHYHRSDDPYIDTTTEMRIVMMHQPIYSHNGNHAVVVIRSNDNKDRWIMGLDLEKGVLSQLDRQHDTAWIGGPGIGGFNGESGNVGWLQDNETIYYQSEETGYSHLYTLHVPSRQKRVITKGNFEVMDVKLSVDKSKFFVHASREGPFENHFYQVSVAGGDLQKISTVPGKHEVVLSPDENHLAILYSYSNQPTELFLMDNSVGAPMTSITESTTEEFKSYPWRDPEIIYIPARDGAKVPARIYRPEADRKNGAAVIFVHGAGYLHNVHKWWSSYFREFMFHNLLADAGYTVLDIDYRASAGYGRDWRTGIYRFMGGKDLDDQVDGAKYLVEKEGIDAERLGIYGGSYGGFITLMALCTSPGTFKCGAALRSVTDWAHYNHGYTSNILNTPVTDSIAFYRSSPIYHAEGLEGHLVMLHGMVDTNVQFQDVVRMSQRFIESGKDNWELAVFPMEGHGFVEPSSWTDEYKRIFRLFEEHLR